MPKYRYQRREPTDDWQQLRPLLKDSGQITYEIIRPVILRGVTPKERWEPGEVEWHVILRCEPPGPRRKRKGRVFVIQPHLPLEQDRTAER